MGALGGMGVRMQDIYTEWKDGTVAAWEGLRVPNLFAAMQMQTPYQHRNYNQNYKDDEESERDQDQWEPGYAGVGGGAVLRVWKQDVGNGDVGSMNMKLNEAAVGGQGVVYTDALEEVGRVEVQEQQQQEHSDYPTNSKHHIASEQKQASQNDESTGGYGNAEVGNTAMSN